VASWHQGDEIPLPGRTLRVLGVRDDDADQPPALVVEDMPGTATKRRRLTFRRFGVGPGGVASARAFGSPPGPFPALGPSSAMRCFDDGLP
jgi:hypothetical protein